MRAAVFLSHALTRAQGGDPQDSTLGGRTIIERLGP